MVSSEVTAKPAKVFDAFSGTTSIVHVVLSPSTLYRTDSNCLTPSPVNSPVPSDPSIERFAARFPLGRATSVSATAASASLTSVFSSVATVAAFSSLAAS